MREIRLHREMDDQLIAVNVDHPIFAYSHAIEEPCRQRFGSKIAG
jgi:hypothetical protein